MAQPLKATFFAFRKREKSGVLLGASVAFAVGLVILLLAFGVAIAAIMGVGPGSFLNPAASEAAATQLAANGFSAILWVLLAEFVMLAAFFVLFAAYEAACLRWMILGEHSGLFGLSLNADTWRVYGTYWMWLLMLIVGYVGIAILAVVATLAATSLSNVSTAAGIGATLVVVVALTCLPVYLLVRTAPAAATSIGERRFAFFDSWKVSKGRFWALFGSYLLLWLINMVVICAMWGAWLGYAFGPYWSEIAGSLGDPQRQSEILNSAMIQAMSAPGALTAYWGLQIAGLAVGVVFYVLFFGINARAVLAAGEEGKITVVGGPSAAEVFR